MSAERVMAISGRGMGGALALLAAAGRLGEDHRMNQPIVIRAEPDDHIAAPVAMQPRKEIKMGEAARKKAMAEIQGQMRQASIAETTKLIWEKSDHKRADELLVELVKLGIPRCDMVVIAAGLISIGWGEVIDAEPDIFLSSVAQLVLGMRAGQRVAQAADAETARASQADKDAAQEAAIDDALAAEMHTAQERE